MKKGFASFRRDEPNLVKERLMKKLTKTQRHDIRAIARQKDENIDFSDAPPVVDWSAAEIGKFHRPAKKPVTMRLDSDVVEWLKSDGRGYQTKANWLLRQAMNHMKRPRRVAHRAARVAKAK